MDLKEAIYTRRSVRDFTDKPVDEKTLRQLARRGNSGAQRGQSTAVVILCGAGQNSARPHIGRSEGTYAQDLAGRTVTSFPGNSERSQVRCFPSCARARRDLEHNGEPVGR